MPSPENEYPTLAVTESISVPQNKVGAFARGFQIPVKGPKGATEFKLPGSIINGSEIWLVTTYQAGYSSKGEAIPFAEPLP